MGRGGVTVGDEEGDDPTRNGDFGPLVAEDEEGAEDRRFVPEGFLEESGAGGRRVGVRDGRLEQVDGRGVLFVVPEGDEGEEEVGEGDGQGDEVEGAPCAAVGDECGRHQWADGTADAVATVHAAQSRRAFGEVGAEDVVGGQVRCYAQPQEEKSHDHDGKGRLADKHYITGCHYGLSQYEHLRSSEASLECLGDWCSTYEPYCVGDEDEGDDGVANVVVLLDVRDQGSWGGIIQAVSEVHEAT